LQFRIVEVIDMKDDGKTKKQLIHELAELRQRIAALEESKTGSQQSEKELMDSSLDSIMFTETIGYITKVNKQFLELLGYRDEEVVGKFVAELTPMNEGETYESVTGELVTIDKEFLDTTQTMIEELLTKGKVANWEAYFLCKDKKVVPIEQNIVCLYDKKGERTGAVSIIRDITDRRQTEKELERHRYHLEDLVKERTEKLSETKDYLDNIIASSLDCIIVGDSTGNIRRVNESLLQLIVGFFDFFFLLLTVSDVPVNTYRSYDIAFLIVQIRYINFNRDNFSVFAKVIGNPIAYFPLFKQFFIR